MKYQKLILLILLLVTVGLLPVVAEQADKIKYDYSGIYINEDIESPVTKILVPEVKKVEVKTFDFESKTVFEDIKNYIKDNFEYPKGYILQLSFSYDKKGVVSNIHLISILEKDFNKKTYSSRIYGDVCKRDGLEEDQIYISENSMIADLKVGKISNTKEGKYLLKIYDIIKNIGKTHIIDMPNFEQISEIYTISGMYYAGKLFLYTDYNQY